MPTDFAVQRAEQLAEQHTLTLEAVARAFAKGKATRDDLLAAARKATNAHHAVGRVKRGSR